MAHLANLLCVWVAARIGNALHRMNDFVVAIILADDEIGINVVRLIPIDMVDNGSLG